MNSITKIVKIASAAVAVVCFHNITLAGVDVDSVKFEPARFNKVASSENGQNSSEPQDLDKALASFLVNARSSVGDTNMKWSCELQPEEYVEFKVKPGRLDEGCIHGTFKNPFKKSVIRVELVEIE